MFHQFIKSLLFIGLNRHILKYNVTRFVTTSLATMDDLIPFARIVLYSQRFHDAAAVRLSVTRKDVEMHRV
ncbi:NusA antitermination factor [Alicyclobacillus hesperidum URH17-3-68]|nr:NusA antitermination factor [Alicyclobacillus hesperidum URH17-3-68]